MAVDGASDLQPFEAQLVHHPVELGNGQIDVLQRHGGAHPDEAVWMIGNGLGEIVVLDAGEFCPERSGRPVEILRNEGGETLNVDPHPIHVFESSGRIGEGVDDGREHHAVVLLRVGPHVVVVRLVLRARVRCGQLLRSGGCQMAMHIDNRCRVDQGLAGTACHGSTSECQYLSSQGIVGHGDRPSPSAAQVLEMGVVGT